MKIIPFIEDEPVESLKVERDLIRKILKHLGLWSVKLSIFASPDSPTTS